MGGEPPVSIQCDELLTTEHILVSLSDLIEARKQHFTVQSLKVLFMGISLNCIFDYLKKINILESYKKKIFLGVDFLFLLFLLLVLSTFHVSFQLMMCWF